MLSGGLLDRFGVVTLSLQPWLTRTWRRGYYGTYFSSCRSEALWKPDQISNNYPILRTSSFTVYSKRRPVQGSSSNAINSQRGRECSHLINSIIIHVCAAIRLLHL